MFLRTDNNRGQEEHIFDRRRDDSDPWIECVAAAGSCPRYSVAPRVGLRSACVVCGDFPVGGRAEAGSKEDALIERGAPGRAR